MERLKKHFKELDKSVDDKTLQIIKKFMVDRERINEAFDKDPHQNTEMANRIQSSKLQLDLQNKADKFELENLNMTKCNRTEMNALADKISVLQGESSMVICLFNESIKMNME